MKTKILFITSLLLILGCEKDEIIYISAKEGIGIEEQKAMRKFIGNKGQQSKYTI